MDPAPAQITVQQRPRARLTQVNRLGTLFAQEVSPMFAPETPGPAKQIVIGAALSLLAFGALSVFLNGCGASVTPQLVECKLNALRILPKDPMQVTFADGVDLVERINACEREAAADGGAP